MTLSQLERIWLICERPESFHINLFVWLLIGKIWIFFRVGLSPLTEAEVPFFIRMIWVLLGFLCPIMIFIGYWLIYGRTGKSRYRGYWLRLGGDLGQFFILPIFIYNFLSVPYFNDGAHIFAASLIAPVVTFLIFMTIRDVLILRQVEKISTEILESEHALADHIRGN